MIVKMAIILDLNVLSSQDYLMKNNIVFFNTCEWVQW